MQVNPGGSLSGLGRGRRRNHISQNPRGEAVTYLTGWIDVQYRGSGVASYKVDGLLMSSQQQQQNNKCETTTTTTTATTMLATAASTNKSSDAGGFWKKLHHPLPSQCRGRIKIHTRTPFD
ncbi:unnamed protein product [Ectocarpus sp. 12 AP-2014]